MILFLTFWFIHAAGALVIAIAAVLGFVLLDGDGDGDGNRIPPGSPPGSTAPSQPARPDIQVGGRCQWQEVAAAETAADGTPVRCVRQPDGGYTWEPVR